MSEQVKKLENLAKSPGGSVKPLDFISLVTVPIEVIGSTGASLGDATGFFYKKDADFIYLVTNWHVVTARDPSAPSHSRTGAIPTKLSLKCHKNVGPGKISKSKKRVIGITINDTSGNYPEWLEHPHHKHSVDVVVIKIERVVDFMENAQFNCLIDDGRLQIDFSPSVMDDVFVVGYPWGLTGGDAVLPLYKRGSVASEPAVDYNQLPCFLIDCRTARSMSGSPVFCSHSGIWCPTDKIDDSIIGTVMNFAGVYSGRRRDKDAAGDAPVADQISEIGIVWRKEALDTIVEAGVTGTKLSELV